MKRIAIAIVAGTLIFSLGLSGCQKKNQRVVENAPYTIEVGGSTSVTPLVELLAEGYSHAKPHIKININGTGSGDGIRNAGQLYQIGMSSRELTPAEQGQGLSETIVAIDGIAVIMNKDSPVTNLTIEQIRDIYTGEITDWSQITGGAKRGRIAVISREEGSGTRGAFEELVGFQGKLMAGANESTSTGAIKAGIVSNLEAIGYISLGSVDDTIKAIGVNGVTPSSANVLNGSYRIARPFILLNGNNLHPESKAFVDWAMGSEGQAIVKKSWIPVK
ncbi:MAG: phosphate ABC transporter substrate-binding protein [Treponema sp.]|jgi:phosphate transport system substrate-binding protein|nr:phosphate ABC transporter substrate-binding protein [Treponema sp.]